MCKKKRNDIKNVDTVFLTIVWNMEERFTCTVRKIILGKKVIGCKFFIRDAIL